MAPPQGFIGTLAGRPPPGALSRLDNVRAVTFLSVRSITRFFTV